MKRRDFLVQSIFLSGAASLPFLLTQNVLAQTSADPHFFVLLNVFGGMDGTLGLDPQLSTPDEKELFLGYREADVVQDRGLLLGPSATGLKKHSPDIAIVNGIVMHDSNVDHEAHTRYINSGKGTSGTDLPVLFAQKNPSAGGVIQNVNLEFQQFASTPNTSINDLNTSISAGFRLEAACNRLQRQTNRNSSFMRSLQQACAARPLTEELKKKYETIPQLRIPGAQNNDTNPYRALATAFVSGYASQAKLRMRTSNLDSHASHSEIHPPAQKLVWDEVSAVFDYFKSIEYGGEGKSLFDFTTFMVTTEFTRTPSLNSSQGKDHNPQTNSVLLAGKGIHGGQVIGKSTLVQKRNSTIGISALWGMPYNYNEGRVANSPDEAKSPDFQFIQPENIVGSLLSSKYSSNELNILGFNGQRFPVLKKLLKSGG